MPCYAVYRDRIYFYLDINNGKAYSYEYGDDGVGNPTQWGTGVSLTWQRGRQLASYTSADSNLSYIYVYDDNGIRTEKRYGVVDGSTARIVSYNVVDGTLRSMVDENNSTLQFVYGNGLTSVIYGGAEYWYVYNAQGDVVGLIDQNGNYVVEYTYDAWGKPLSKTGTLATTLGTANPFRYRGYIYDEETGFYYVSSRYYDPAIGRWLNSDSVVAGVGRSVQGYNLFEYCFNDPINYIDSTGQFPFWILGIIAVSAVAGGVIASQAPINLADAALDSTPKMHTVEKPPVDFRSLNQLEISKPNANRNSILQPKQEVFPQYNSDTPTAPIPSRLATFNPASVVNLNENGLTTGEVVTNTLIGVGVGTMVGGSVTILAGVAGALGYTTVFGATGVEAFSLGALAYDVVAMFFIPLFGIETEMVELGP